MTLYRLEPVNRSHILWALSTERRPVIVRARSKRSARRVAARAFSIVPLDTASPPPDLPWKIPEMVTVAVVTDLRWPDAGPFGFVHVEGAPEPEAIKKAS